MEYKIWTLFLPLSSSGTSLRWGRKLVVQNLKLIEISVILLWGLCPLSTSDYVMNSPDHNTEQAFNV